MFPLNLPTEIWCDVSEYFEVLYTRPPYKYCCLTWNVHLLLFLCDELIMMWNFLACLFWFWHICMVLWFLSCSSYQACFQKRLGDVFNKHSVMNVLHVAAQLQTAHWQMWSVALNSPVMSLYESSLWKMCNEVYVTDLWFSVSFALLRSTPFPIFSVWIEFSWCHSIEPWMLPAFICVRILRCFDIWPREVTSDISWVNWRTFSIISYSKNKSCSMCISPLVDLLSTNPLCVLTFSLIPLLSFHLLDLLVGPVFTSHCLLHQIVPLHASAKVGVISKSPRRQNNWSYLTRISHYF